MHNQSINLNYTSLTTANLVSSGLMGLFFLFGVPGNVAVILFIVLYFKKENFTVKLMLNLAAADIMCLITLPVWIYGELNSIDQLTCKFFIVLIYCSMYSSVITVTMLSVYRCLRIQHPQKWSRLGKRRERALLFISWALALLFSCPGVLAQETTERASETVCERNLNSKDRRIIAILETLLGFFLPFTIMLTSYYFLHKKVTQGVFSHRQRATKLVTRIVIIFFMFWAPYQIINLVKICSLFFRSSQPVSSKLYNFIEYTGAGMLDIAGCLTFINSCAHPFLYAFSSNNLFKKNNKKRSAPLKR